MDTLLILLIALVIDIILGEAPNRFHPVAWLGSFINCVFRLAPEKGKKKQLTFGVPAVLGTVALFTCSLSLVTFQLQAINHVIYIIVASCLLKNTFSIRGLWKAVGDVKTCLAANKINDARMKVRSLVQRDTNALSKSHVISAAIESCAENICDSFVAPLFYFAIFGLPGAIAYRIINTLDAMIGYHGNWEYTGKFAARLDDIANYIPARISAFLIVIASAMTGNSVKQSWCVMSRDHKKTESPNAGWTMSAMAGSLGVELEKVGHYRIGDNHRALTPSLIANSQLVMLTAAALWSTFIMIEEAACCVMR